MGICAKTISPLVIHCFCGWNLLMFVLKFLTKILLWWYNRLKLHLQKYKRRGVLSIIELYHGSEKIVEKPEHMLGKSYNDYGRGFYCTENEDKAKEWACFFGKDGYVNKYLFDSSSLSVLDVLSGKDGILKHVALVLANRKMKFANGEQKMIADRIVDKYLPGSDEYDVIVGARCDDSYFSFVRAFIAGELSIERLKIAYKNTSDCAQVVLKSERAIRALKFSDVSVADGTLYGFVRKNKDAKLRELVFADADIKSEGTYVVDVIRGEN